MEPGELVALVNDWGTLPGRIGNRPVPHDTGHHAAGRIAVADRLHAVFASPKPAGRMKLVNAMLEETGVQPVLAPVAGRTAAAWRVPRASQALLASAALALREHLAAHPERLGVCTDGQCADVYVDTSPAGHRRFCSVTCQNRSRVAAFRQRRRVSS
jgi:predicted RNA-binding Zn ribbon-like protein